jgi:CheY-like chemotaxis protein
MLPTIDDLKGEQMSLALKNLTVLVVDDDLDDCEYLRSLLEKSGASVMVARSVADALELQRQSPAHVVVADIHLGGWDSYALIKGIRKCNLDYRGFTAAIAIAGFASPADKQRAIMAGFDAYLPKSIEPAYVVSTIARVLHDSRELAA